MTSFISSLLKLDRTVHEPARLMILALLQAVQEADFLFIMKEGGLTRGNLSSHMSRLEAAGYIAVEKGYSGRTPRTVLSITGEGRDALDRYRSEMSRVLENI